jgi:endonuclease III
MPAARVREIVARLRDAYPDARVSLDFENPFQLLIATILSAQSTDARVNIVTKDLFRKYPDAEALAGADPAQVEEDIRPTGFFRNKTKSIMGAASAIVERHGGAVPDTMEELVALPDVGRKTANVVLGNAFRKSEGVVVDTHVGRVSGRLGLTAHADAEKIEQDLIAAFPREEWTSIAHRMILHGRHICIARKPKCGQCVLSDLCPSAELPVDERPPRKQRLARVPKKRTRGR